MRNKKITYVLGILFLISSLYTVSSTAGDKYINLDIGECVLNISLTSRVGINSDYDITFYDIKNGDVYILSWRKDALNYLKKDLRKYKFKIKTNKYLKIIDIKNKPLQKIVGRNFYITISKRSESLDRQILSCNNSWRENPMEIDIETMINKFHINDKEVKILEELINDIM